jgi:hypothetical protein
MDYINKFKINGVVVGCKSEDIPMKNGNSFTLKKIKVEQEENNGRYVKKDVFEIQMDFDKNNIMEGDVVEITGVIKTNPSKDGSRWFMSLVGTNCKVIHRPNAKYQVYNNNEQSEPNPCLDNEDNEEYPF